MKRGLLLLALGGCSLQAGCQGNTSSGPPPPPRKHFVRLLGTNGVLLQQWYVAHDTVVWQHEDRWEFDCGPKGAGEVVVVRPARDQAMIEGWE